MEIAQNVLYARATDENEAKFLFSAVLSATHPAPRMSPKAGAVNVVKNLAQEI
jgi:hypothetical protein